MPVGRNPERKPRPRPELESTGLNRPTWVVALRTEEGWPKKRTRSEDAAGENPL